MLKHLTLAATTAAALFTTAPAQAGDGDFVGEIIMFGSNFCPRGYLRADGRLLPVSGNEALFSLYGTNFGGDGRTTFALPDLMARAPEAIFYCVNLVGIYPSRS
ncbi:tail fiber protein [uncultured Shimia sp.]|uniref:phage tail protein n=1 Tax=uncultured Shimia sp. TaxID=573152 RepID=UPI0034520682